SRRPLPRRCGDRRTPRRCGELPQPEPARAAGRGGAPARRRAPRERIVSAARAFHLYDLDRIEARARRFVGAFAGLELLPAYAVKANGLPAILERLRA